MDVIRVCKITRTYSMDDLSFVFFILKAKFALVLTPSLIEFSNCVEIGRRWTKVCQTLKWLIFRKKLRTKRNLPWKYTFESVSYWIVHVLLTIAICLFCKRRFQIVSKHKFKFKFWLKPIYLGEISGKMAIWLWFWEPEYLSFCPKFLI